MAPSGPNVILVLIKTPHPHQSFDHIIGTGEVEIGESIFDSLWPAQLDYAMLFRFSHQIVQLADTSFVPAFMYNLFRPPNWVRDLSTKSPTASKLVSYLWMVNWNHWTALFRSTFSITGHCFAGNFRYALCRFHLRWIIFICKAIITKSRHQMYPSPNVLLGRWCSWYWKGQRLLSVLLFDTWDATWLI